MPSELWNKVLVYDLDQPVSSYCFSIRLADENFWTRNFTQKAILEYKKFMYLAATSEFMVSPSPIIDKVWHEHLMFSKSYQSFCDLLGKNIQHVPSTLDPAQYQKFRSARERTKKLYLSTFGEAPEDIWSYESMYDSLNLPKARIKIRTFIIIGLLTTAVIFFPAYFLLKPFFLTIHNPEFLFGYVSIVIICLAVLEFWNRKKLRLLVSSAHPKSFVFDLQPLELIYLETQKLYKAINGPMNKLVIEKKITIDNEKRLHAQPINDHGSLDEYEIFLAFDKYCGNNTYPPLLSILTKSPVFTNISKSMDALKKYVVKSKPYSHIFYVTFTILALLLVAGMTRLAIGLERGKPVTFIGLTMLVMSVGFGFYLYRLSQMICTTIIPSYYRRNVVPKLPSSSDSYWQYMLLGTAALLPAFQSLDSFAQRNTLWTDGSSMGTSSSDLSDGGSSCGTSCSSCGGCGGD